MHILVYNMVYGPSVSKNVYLPCYRKLTLNENNANLENFCVSVNFRALNLLGWRSTGTVGAEKNVRSSEICLDLVFCLLA